MAAPAAAESAQKDVKRKLTRVVRNLEDKYGPHIYPEDASQLDQLVFAILAADNPVTNARKAIKDFKEDFVDWNEVRVSTVRQLEDALEAARIEPAARHAEHLKGFLEKTFHEVSRVNLETLRTEGPEKARKTVAKLDVLEIHEQQYLLVGAGVEDAPPLGPVTDRICLRVGVFQPDEPAQKRRKLLESLVTGQDAIRFHHLMLEHGKKLCTEVDPRCPRCPVQNDCDYFRALEARRRIEEKERAKSGAKKAAAAASAASGKTSGAAAKASKPLKAPLGKRTAGGAGGPSKAKMATKKGKRGRSEEDE